MFSPCLICLNIMAFIVGGAMTGFGVWMLSAGTSLFEVLGTLEGKLKTGISMESLAQVAERKGVLRIMAITLTVTGAVGMTTAFIGIMALVQKSSFFAIVYNVVLLFLLVGHLAGTAFLLIKKPTLGTEIQVSMLTNQKKYFVARTSFFNTTSKLQQAFTKFFEHMHISFGCCGVTNRSDIRNSSSFLKSIAKDPSFTALLPDTCCKLKNKAGALSGKKPQLVNIDCPNSLNSSTLHKQPCFQPVRRLVDKLVLPVLIFCGVFALVLASVLGMMAAQMCCAETDDSDSDSDHSISDESDADMD